MSDIDDIFKGLGKLVAGVIVMAIVVGVFAWITTDNSDSDKYNYDEGNGSSGRNINFKQSYQSKYGGNPCSYKEYSGGLTCSEKHDCYGGFSSSNRDASICGNCGHSYSYHK